MYSCCNSWETATCFPTNRYFFRSYILQLLFLGWHLWAHRNVANIIFMTLVLHRIKAVLIRGKLVVWWVPLV